MDFLLRNLVIFAIAPCVGAWIEVVVSIKQTPPVVSHPTWVRGLKYHKPELYVLDLEIAPCVGGCD